MLFNSFSFIFLFLPASLAGWLILRRWGGMRMALGWLVLASLFFYAMWDVAYLAVLLSSITINFWMGGKILAARQAQREPAASLWLKAGLAVNLLILGSFKYSYFVAANLFGLFHLDPPFSPIVLPLAISFVTFQKIAYLVDCRRGLVARHNALDYLFFVSFFPQLIAGPIVHHKQLTAQIVEEKNLLFGDPATLVAGFSFFAIGLFKKVVLADGMARYATPVFEAARSGIPGGEAAWQAMLGYTLQLYFDFSGYSDMAIGLALLFGFKLPINFASPYQANSIIDFWRRWHISLSNFLRDYLYIPLGGNRHGPVVRYRNLWLTMLLAGLWHGAGWNFLLWGGAHGVLLLLNHAWRNLLGKSAALAALWDRLPAAFCVALSFLLVALAWVLFRAPDLASAGHMYTALLHPLSGAALPAAPWPEPGQLLETVLSAAPPAGWLWIGAGLLIVSLLPNSAQLLAYDATPNQRLPLKPRFSLGLLSGACCWLALKWMAVRPATEFLYFNF